MSKAKKLIEGILGESSDDSLLETVSDFLCASNYGTDEIIQSSQFKALLKKAKNEIEEEWGGIVGGFVTPYHIELLFENNTVLKVELKSEIDPRNTAVVASREERTMRAAMRSKR